MGPWDLGRGHRGSEEGGVQRTEDPREEGTPGKATAKAGPGFQNLMGDLRAMEANALLGCLLDKQMLLRGSDWD